MFKKIFSLSNSAKQSFTHSGNDFKIAANSAGNFITHSSTAAIAATELSKQIGLSLLAGSVAVVAGAGLCFASAVFFPAFIAPVTAAIGWGVFTNPFSVVSIAVGSSLIHDSTNIKNFGINSWETIKDAVSVPYHAVKGVGEAVIGTGKSVYNVANETLIAIRSPNQESVDNKDGKHIQIIGDSWFKEAPEKDLSAEDFIKIEDNIEENFFLIDSKKELPKEASAIKHMQENSSLEDFFVSAQKSQDFSGDSAADIIGDNIVEAAVAAA